MTRSFTPGEALDILNGVLMIDGYTLVRRKKMLLILDLEDEVDAQLVQDLLTEIPLEQLDARGEFEPTKCRFSLQHISPEEAEKQINQLLSPLGSIVVIPRANQLVVTETGGTLRAMREILDNVDQVAEDALKALQSFPVKNVSAIEVLAVARQNPGYRRG